MISCSARFQMLSLSLSRPGPGATVRVRVTVAFKFKPEPPEVSTWWLGRPTVTVLSPLCKITSTFRLGVQACQCRRLGPARGPGLQVRDSDGPSWRLNPDFEYRPPRAGWAAAWRRRSFPGAAPTESGPQARPLVKSNGLQFDMIKEVEIPHIQKRWGPRHRYQSSALVDISLT